MTPPGMHAEMACVAIRTGKHVLLEKPAAITLEEAQAILATQKETGMIITVVADRIAAAAELNPKLFYK